jgi:dolichol kinase
MEKSALGRKLFHFASTIFPLLYILTTRTTALIVVIAFLIASSVFEFLRIRGFIEVALIQKYIGIKTTETARPTGSFFVIVSALITILFFRRDVAVASLFVLAMADPLASLAGSVWGKRPLFGKSWEGTLTFFVVSLVILKALLFAVPAAVTGALVATLTELFSPRFLDDNLSIPIVTGLVLTVMG